MLYLYILYPQTADVRDTENKSDLKADLTDPLYVFPDIYTVKQDTAMRGFE